MADLLSDLLNTPDEQEDNSTSPLLSDLLQQPDPSASIRAGLEVNPDEAAKNRKLSKQSGVSYEAVTADPDLVDKQVKERAIGSLVADKPVTNEWLAQPINAQVASDDVPNLTAVEDAWFSRIFNFSQAREQNRREIERTKQLQKSSENLTWEGAIDIFARAPSQGLIDTPGSALRGAGELYNVVGRAISRPIYNMLDMVGLSDFSDALRGAQVPWYLNPGGIVSRPGENIGALADYVGVPSDRRNLATETTNAIGQAAGQIATLLLTGGAAGSTMLFAQGADQMNQSVEDLSMQGTPEGDAAILTGAAITGITEKYGLDNLMTRIPNAYKTTIFKILAGMGSEASQEVMEQVGQNLTIMALLDPDQPLFKGATDVATPAGLAGGILAALLPGRTHIQTQAEAALNGTYDAETIDQVQKLLAGGKLAQRDPEKAAEHNAAVMDKAGITDVYVSADAIANAAVASGDPSGYYAILGIEDQMADALVVGGDVRLNNKTFSDLLLSDDYALIRDHVRLRPDSMTIAEAQDFAKSGLQDEMNVLEMGTAIPETDPYVDFTPTPFDINRPEVYDQLKEGGFTDKEISVLTPQEVELLLSPITADPIQRASEQDIGLAEQELGLHGMFRSAKEAGMSDKEFQSYLVSRQKAADKGRINQQRKIVHQAIRETKAEWLREYEDTQAEVLDAVRQEPVYQALTNIQRERLDQAQLLELFDKETLATLPKTIDGRAIFAPKGEKGVDPHLFAVSNGFDTVQDMILAMTDALPITEAVRRRTDAVMKQRHGDILERQRALEEARQSLHNNDQAEVLAAELNALTGAKKEGRIKQSMIRARAKEMIGNHKVTQVDPKTYLRNEAKWGRLAGRFLRAGDRVSAARAKYHQLMNFQMAQEAYQVQKEMQRGRKFIDKFLKKRSVFKSMDADYVDAIKQILSDYKFTPPMSAVRRKNLNAWAFAKAVETGQSILSIDQEVFKDDRKKNYRSLSVSEFQELINSLQFLEKEGKAQKKFTVAGRQREFQDVKTELLSSSSKLPELKGVERQRKNQNPSFLERAAATARGVHNAFTKAELLLQKLDNGVIAGAWHKAIFQKAADAQHKQAKLLKKHFKPIVEAMTKLPEGTKKRLNETVSLGNRMGKRSDLLMMALNSGNTSNMQKMIEGSAKDNGAAPLDEHTVNLALSQLTNAEWNWVQKVWDTFEDLYPEVKKIYRDEFGTDPQKVEPRQIVLQPTTDHPYARTIKGGYFPVMYDPNRRPTQPIGTTEEMIDARERTATVYSGMTKARTGYSAPVLLDLNALPKAAEQVVHYISHYGAVKDIRRLLGDREIASEIRNKLGIEAHKELMSWAGAIARSHEEPYAHPKIAQISNFLRGNVVTATLGGSFNTLASQTLGRFTSVAVLGQKEGGGFSVKDGEYWLSKGYETYLSDPVEATKDAFNKSKELHTRLQSVDRDIAEGFKKLNYSGGKGVLRTMYNAQKRAGLMAIGGLQLYTIDLPTWIAGYEQAVSRGKTVDEAAEYADSVLRTSQGSGHKKDLSAIQRSNNPISQWFTMFSTYMMLAYNLEAQTLNNARKPKNLPGALTRLTWLMVLPAIADGLMKGDGPDDDDDETWAQWAMQKVRSYQLGILPFVGSPLRSASEGYDPSKSVTPLQILPAAMWEAVKEVEKLVTDDKEVDLKTLQKLARPFGLLGGISGTAQVNRTLDALQDDESTPLDLITGKK